MSNGYIAMWSILGVAFAPAVVGGVMSIWSALRRRHS